MLISGLLVVTFYLVQPRIDQKTFESLLSLTPLSKERFDNLLANPWSAVLVFLGLSWLFSKLIAVEVLEFHLFPWFDEESLRPVGSQTGMLNWVDFEDSPTHDAAQKLRAWLSESVHDGAWPLTWVLRGRPSLREQSFSYALLLGPNGVGKSQLAREVSREKLGVRLRQRGLASKRDALVAVPEPAARWFCRVLPRVQRRPDDFWHVGEINPLVGYWSERLKVWRPSAPTVLIIDDPYGALAHDAIDILDKNSGEFWYSVKLILVDQFTPSKLQLEKIGAYWRDQLGREIPMFSIPDVHWSGEQVRRAFAGGVWVRNPTTGEMRLDPAHDIPEFWQTQGLERLGRALDGNPLMLAEAGIWLAARNERGRTYRRIETLLGWAESEDIEQQLFDMRPADDYRSAVANRILKERVDEVFASHLAWAQDMGVSQTAVVEALCCASIAGGVPLVMLEQLRSVQSARLEKWIVQDVGRMAVLPPIGSWPISQAFIERALIDFPNLRLEELVRHALAVNPIGLARQLTRKGSLARQLFDEVARLEDDERMISPLALNLFELAAARAIWADRGAVPKALSALERLPMQELARAQAELERVGSFNGRVPDVTVAALLLAVLGARRFAKHRDWDWSAWESFYLLWSNWMCRPGKIHFVHLAFSEPIKTANRKLFDSFFRAVGNINDPEREFKILTCMLNSPADLFVTEWMIIEDVMPPPSWSAVFRRLILLRILTRNDGAILDDSEAVRRETEALAVEAASLLPSDANARQRAYVDCYILTRRIKFETETGSSLRDILAISAELDALSIDFSHDQDFVYLRLQKNSFVTRRLAETKGDAGLAWSIGEDSEVASKTFLDDKKIVGALIWCWAYALGLAHLEDDSAFDEVVFRLRSYASSFPKDGEIWTAFSKLIDVRGEGLLSLQDKVTVEVRYLELAEQFEEIVRAAPDVSNVLWSQGNFWCRVTQDWAMDRDRGLGIGEVARKLDVLARPFPDHEGLQVGRLAVWRDYAFYQSRHGIAPEEPERIVRQITWAAERFRGGEFVSSMVATAWEAAVFGWHRDPRAWHSCERALRRLENWIAENRTKKLTAALPSAWGAILIVHRRRRDFGALARLEPEALACAVSAVGSDDEDIAEFAGHIFAEIAMSRQGRNLGRKALEDMGAQLDSLLARFPRSQSLIKNVEFVHRILSRPAADPTSAH